MYMLITMIYIFMGLAITTMCIDLAGTEYIRKIHYFGQKIETAKGFVGGAVVTGLHVGGDVLKQIRSMRNQVAVLRRRGMLPADFDLENLTESQLLALHPNFLNRRDALENVLYTPISPEIQRVLKPGIKLMPDEIKESDAYILENKMFGQNVFAQFRRKKPKRRVMDEFRRIPANTWPEELSAPGIPVFIAPFILKESNV